MKTVGTKAKILMLVLAFVLVANMAPAHAIDKSATDVKMATLQDLTAIKVNGIVMPYRPYLIDGELYAPAKMMELALNASVDYDVYKRELVVGPMVADFEDRSAYVDQTGTKFFDKNLPEYTTARFLCNTVFKKVGDWYPVDKYADKIALIEGEVWMSLAAIADFAGATYSFVPEIDSKYTNYANIMGTRYLIVPDVNDITDIVITQPYYRFLTPAQYPLDLSKGEWRGGDLIKIDGKFYHTNVAVNFVYATKVVGDKIVIDPDFLGKGYTVEKVHFINEGPYAGKKVTLEYVRVPFVNCGNYFDFSKKADLNILATDIEGGQIEIIGMDGKTYFYNGQLYHDYYYQDYFKKREKMADGSLRVILERQFFPWTR